MAKGSIISNFDNVELYPVTDTCFRVITSYHYAQDCIITRIDCKIENRQYNVIFGSTTPIEPKAGSPINSYDNLLTPKNGILECLNTRVSKNDLIRALKELIEDLENDGK